jgi:hypothetical protein
MKVSVFPVLILLSLQIARAESWNQFRGGVGGKMAVIRHPLEWSADVNVAWAAPMEGSGWSSPIVVEDRIFLTSAQSDAASRPKGMMAGVASMRSFRSAKPRPLLLRGVEKLYCVRDY